MTDFCYTIKGSSEKSGCVLLKILVVDDEKSIVDNLFSTISERYEADIVTANSISEIIEEKVNVSGADIAFVDIQIKDDNGINLGCYLQQKYPEMHLVFISGYPEKVTDVFLSLSAMGFIDKPIRKEKVYAYIDKAMNQSNEDYFCSSVYGHKTEFHKNNIIFIESSKKVLKIHTTGGVAEVVGKLDDVEKQFEKQFVRCHKSYLVNLKYISCRRLMTFVLINKEEINISRTYKNEAIEKYNRYRGGVLI